jgi:type VI secretion system protein ImpI
MVLEVQITDPKTGSSRKMRFSHSPVRIGRNQLNDLSIDTPFVSEWHGTIRFDNRSVAYFDLGSTNGSMLDGKRLTKNVAVELTEASRLQVGGVELSISVQQGDANLGKTLGWGVPDDRTSPPGPAPAVIRSPDRPKSGGPGSASPFSSYHPGVSNPGVRPSPILDDAYATPPHGPPPAAHGGSPKASMHGQGSAPVAVPVPSAAGVGSSPFASAPSSGAPDLVARQRQLLEAFAESFVGLRKGYEQFGAEVGVRTIHGKSALHRARTAAEILDYLLQPNLDPAVAARELIGVFADLGIHHIAMMEAITEGVRSVLQSLDPRANELDVGAGGILSRGKTKAQWKNYLERFDQLVTDDEELHTAIFSDDFARAYASVTLGEEGVRRKKEDKK